MVLQQMLIFIIISTIFFCDVNTQQINRNDAQVEHRAASDVLWGDELANAYNLFAKKSKAIEVMSNSAAQDFKKIQEAAAKLVEIQTLANQKGSFNAEDNHRYAINLYELGQAAQKLAELHQSGQVKDFSQLIQTAVGAQKVEETSRPNPEDDLLPPNTEDPYEDVNDSVAITLPHKDASIAEAKPEGLSIAGVGGVASSKPNAVALSGLNGLAVASPKATAISGVTAEEAAAYSISLPSRNHLIIKSGHQMLEPQNDHINFDEREGSQRQSPNEAFKQKMKMLLELNRNPIIRDFKLHTIKEN